jgi:uncharacterized membrane protein YjjB (DUF3815 family)
MSQLWSAFWRSLVSSAGAAIATVSTLMAARVDNRQIVWAAIAAFVAPLVTRFGAEGGYDASRAARGIVRPSDVGAQPPA